MAEAMTGDRRTAMQFLRTHAVAVLQYDRPTGYLRVLLDQSAPSGPRAFLDPRAV